MNPNVDDDNSHPKFDLYKFQILLERKLLKKQQQENREKHSGQRSTIPTVFFIIIFFIYPPSIKRPTTKRVTYECVLVTHLHFSLGLAVVHFGSIALVDDGLIDKKKLKNLLSCRTRKRKHSIDKGACSASGRLLWRFTADWRRCAQHTLQLGIPPATR